MNLDEQAKRWFVAPPLGCGWGCRVSFPALQCCDRRQQKCCQTRVCHQHGGWFPCCASCNRKVSKLWWNSLGNGCRCQNNHLDRTKIRQTGRPRVHLASTLVLRPRLPAKSAICG